MDKTKRIKGSFKGIPKHEHARIRKLISGVAFPTFKSKTPLAVWRIVQKHWKEQAAQKAEQEREEAKRAEKARQDAHRRAIERVEKSLLQLAITRDKLRVIEGGGDGAQDEAMFARAALEESGKELETALFQLGIVKGLTCGSKSPRIREGWFAETLDVRTRLTA